MDEEIEYLVHVLLNAAGESPDEVLAAALHSIATSTTSICREFNKHVDAGFQEELAKRGLRPVPLTRLATKNRFGAN